jgi:hypothetical protein
MHDASGDREMALRAAMEDPEVRAARRALDRWTTVERLWAAMDRLKITDDSQRIRFVCRALWPTLSAGAVEALVARAISPDAPESARLRRPTRPDDILGPTAAALLRDHLRAPSSRSRSIRPSPRDAPSLPDD